MWVSTLWLKAVMGNAGARQENGFGISVSFYCLEQSMHRVAALYLLTILAGASVPAFAGNWVMVNPAPFINEGGVYINSSNFFPPSPPPANAAIKSLSWDLSSYDNKNLSAKYEICMLPGVSRCFDVSNNLQSRTNFFNYFKASSSFIVRVKLFGGSYPATAGSTGSHMLYVEWE